MKKLLLAVTVITVFTMAALALKAKTPTSQHLAGNPNATWKTAPQGIPPSLCDPCLFYGGDLDPNDLNAAGMSDENTLLIASGGSNTYGAITIPRTVTVTGILFNVQASTAFDPQTATYDIRSGMSDGNGGTEIASGSGNIKVAATGRNFLGFNEFTVEVDLASPQTLSAGTYWFSTQPQCTNTLDGSCSVGRIFVSNTTSQTNNVAGWVQPLHQLFFNSGFFGFTYTNWCDSSLGFNPHQCAFLSFGLVGNAD